MSAVDSIVSVTLESGRVLTGRVLTEGPDFIEILIGEPEGFTTQAFIPKSIVTHVEPA